MGHALTGLCLVFFNSNQDEHLMHFIPRCQLQLKLKRAFEGFFTLSNASGIILCCWGDAEVCIVKAKCNQKKNLPILLNTKKKNEEAPKCKHFLLY